MTQRVLFFKASHTFFKSRLNVYIQTKTIYEIKPAKRNKGETKRKINRRESINNCCISAHH
jgi:hypothetical protein